MSFGGGNKRRGRIPKRLRHCGCLRLVDGDLEVFMDSYGDGDW